jgi:hypothetical protein
MRRNCHPPQEYAHWPTDAEWGTVTQTTPTTQHRNDNTLNVTFANQMYKNEVLAGTNDSSMELTHQITPRKQQHCILMELIMYMKSACRSINKSDNAQFQDATLPPKPIRHAPPLPLSPLP